MLGAGGRVPVGDVINKKSLPRGSEIKSASNPPQLQFLSVMLTFHIFNFGCRASQADGASLKQKLIRAGMQESATVEASAVAVLNTCTVTATADTEIRQIVRRIHRRNPKCRILVTGCYAQRAPQ